MRILRPNISLNTDARRTSAARLRRPLVNFDVRPLESRRDATLADSAACNSSLCAVVRKRLCGARLGSGPSELPLNVESNGGGGVRDADVSTRCDSSSSPVLARVERARRIGCSDRKQPLLGSRSVRSVAFPPRRSVPRKRGKCVIPRPRAMSTAMRPNPSLHPTAYSALRPLPSAGELKR